MKNKLLNLIITSLLALFLCRPALALDITGEWDIIDTHCRSGCKTGSRLGTIYINQNEDGSYSGEIYTSDSRGTCDKVYIRNKEVDIYCGMENDTRPLKGRSLLLNFIMHTDGSVLGILSLYYGKKEAYGVELLHR